MKIRVIVTGLAATYPMGGVFWDYLQYVLGFLKLGHDVLYLEDTGQWLYDPANQDFTPNGSENAAFLAEHIRRLEPALSDRWFLRDATGRSFGRSTLDVTEYCRTADLFINLSGACYMRDEYFSAERVAFVDSDPMYTQALFPSYLAGVAADEEKQQIDRLLCHDVFFTFGECVNQPECKIPSGLVHWIPTRQPVAVDSFESAAVRPDRRRRTFTTIGSWEPKERPGIWVGDTEYFGKSREFERYMELPLASPAPIEVALAGKFSADAFLSKGWRLANPREISSDPWTYRDYLANSLGEWSVAKHAYVASRSGWFSCRTACYLALGVPAVVQDTGFTDFIPTGEGLFGFTDIDGCLTGLEAILSAPEHQSEAAHGLSREYFESGRVLTKLIEDAFGSAETPTS